MDLFTDESNSNAPIFSISPIEPRDRMYGIAAPNKEVLWIAGNYGKILRSEDAGVSWSSQMTPVNETLLDIDAWDKNHAVAVGDNSVILFTSDAGSTWTRGIVPRSGIATKLFRVRAVRPGQAWAVGSMGMIMSTDNWGLNWERKCEEEDVAWNGISLVDDNTAWVVGEFGRMRRTTDGGKTWEEKPTLTKSSLMAIHFRDEKHGVAVGLDGVILATADAGQTWVIANSGASEHLFDVIWASEEWIAVGARGILCRGNEGASNWRNERLAEYERGWHTKVVNVSSCLFVVGLSQGRWCKGKWSDLGS